MFRFHLRIGEAEVISLLRSCSALLTISVSVIILPNKRRADAQAMKVTEVTY